MRLLGHLPGAEFSARLKAGTLGLQAGPMRFSVRSREPAIAQGLRLHYGANALVPDGAFCDFHISLETSRGLLGRRHRRIHFLLDGEEPFSPLPAHQAYPLLEWGMNWCISNHAHQFIVLHAAVVERGGQALLMPAPSGAGKSTLCAALCASGWRLLSDELALLSLDGHQVTPVPRPISLKNRSIDVIRGFAPHLAMGPAVQDTLKGTVAHCTAPPAAVAASALPARPAWVVLPQYQPESDLDLAPATRAETLMTCIDACFNFSVHGVTAFEALRSLVDVSTCLRLTYSRLEEAVHWLDRVAAAEAQGAGAA